MPSKAIALDASSTVRNSRKAYALSCRAVRSKCGALSWNKDIPPHSARRSEKRMPHDSTCAIVQLPVPAWQARTSNLHR